MTQGFYCSFTNMLLSSFHRENSNYTVPVCFVSVWSFLYNNRSTRSKLPFAAERTDLPYKARLKLNVTSSLRRAEMSLWMETSDRFNHMGVAVFHGSVRGRRGDSAGRRCCFMGHRSSPTWTAVGKRAFEVRPASPRGVEIGYCCTFSTAEQGECLERSMGTLSGVSNVVTYEQCGACSAQPFQKGPRKRKGEGTGGVMSALCL